jgi:hypothetical protein
MAVCLAVSFTTGAPETNTFVVAPSPGAESGAGAGVAGAALGVAATVLGVGVAVCAGLLLVNHQIAAATAVNATPPMMSGILLPDVAAAPAVADEPADAAAPVEAAGLAKVEGRSEPGEAAIAKSASELTSPNF